MRSLWLLLFPILLAGALSTCQQRSTSPTFDLTQHLTSYDSLRTDMGDKQRWFARVYREADNAAQRQERVKEARNYLNRTMQQQVFDYWYGTDWDYYGTTETPRKGQIACGYFVSTTLLHAGFDLERYKLAQQPASKIIRTLCDENTLKRIGHGNLTGLLQHMEGEPKGIYIIGLDNHVGFVLKDDDGIWMVHSTSSSTARGVVKEKLGESRIVQRSKNYWIANLLDHEALIKKWITHEHINTVT